MDSFSAWLDYASLSSRLFPGGAGTAGGILILSGRCAVAWLDPYSDSDLFH